MCKQERCPVKNKCYRYTAKPDELYQPYVVVEIEHVRDDGCKLFWNN